MQLSATIHRRRVLIAVAIVAIMGSLVLMRPALGRSAEEPDPGGAPAEAGDGAAVTGAGPAAGTTSSTPCSERRGPIVTLEGAQAEFPEGSSAVLADGSIVDARQATWDNASTSDHPVHLKTGDDNARSDLCWWGGKISSDYADSTEWDYWHGVTALRVRVPRMTIDGVRIDNEGDGIGFSDETATDWTVRNAHLSFIHDDCIENDYMHNGLVEDSLLDGCYVAFSARGHSGQSSPPDGLASTWTIKDSLVRLQPMPTVYKGPAPGHGGFFKWSDDPDEGVSVMLSVHDTVFRVDQAPNNGDLGIPLYQDPETGETRSHLADCSNNTVVWLGPGDYPDPLPDCFTVTTDRAVWDEAVAAWLAAHPDNG